jgi:7-cyano-7-deazaguanine synthase in queuosine biosynthesis
MKVLIMYSGGVESTALIQLALEQGHEFELLHVIHNNSSQHEMATAKIIGYPVFDLTYSKDSFDKTHIRPHRDVSLWLTGAMIAVGRDDYEQVWYGVNSTDSQKKIPLMERSWDAMMTILDNRTTIHSPLRMFSKRYQYDMLTSHQKSCIVSCRKGRYDAQCGQCVKCMEFQKYVKSGII